MPSTRLLTVQEAADRLAYRKSKVYELIRAGQLRAVRTHAGAHWRVPEDAIPEFIDSLDSNQQDVA